MPALAERKLPKRLVGSPLPRLAPPTPAKADVEQFRQRAADLSLELYPWQLTAARFLTAKNAKGLPLYREVAVIVARQNGKTRLLLPLIVEALVAGKRVMHAAQTLRLPGEFHRELADLFESKYPELLPSKRGISFRAGQESIRLKGGGFYQIVAATGGAPRGPANQLVIIDEIRELTDDRFLAGIKPTMIAQADAQIVYLSNAGTDESAVLNSLRARAAEDRNLAYLEWSASPEYAPDDVTGWCQANPSIGHREGFLENLEAEYRANMLGGTMAVFETEHLCRWVVAMQSRLVMADVWDNLPVLADAPPRPPRSYMAINMDVTGERASAVVAWADDKGSVTLDVHDTRGAPIDASLLGPDLERLAASSRSWVTGFDPYTDGDLARYLRKSRAVNGREYALASEKFVRLASEGKLRIHDPQGVLGPDMARTIRKPFQQGSYMAVRAGDEPNTAAQAAVRAAWLATAPVPTAPARIY